MEEQLALYTKNTITIHQVQRTLGILISLGELIPLGRLKRRPFQFATKHLKMHRYPKQCKRRIPVTQEMRKALEWWRHRSNTLRRVPIKHKPPTIMLTTDASTVGWGAVCKDWTVRGSWNQTDQGKHINILEMKAIYLAMTHFMGILAYKHIMIMTDNITAMFYIKKQGGTVSQELMTWTEKIWELAAQHNIEISTNHISSDLNVLADRLSRANKPLASEWSLNQEVFRNICIQFSVLRK